MAMCRTMAILGICLQGFELLRVFIEWFDGTKVKTGKTGVDGVDCISCFISG